MNNYEKNTQIAREWIDRRKQATQAYKRKLEGMTDDELREEADRVRRESNTNT